MTSCASVCQAVRSAASAAVEGQEVCARTWRLVKRSRETRRHTGARQAPTAACAAATRCKALYAQRLTLLVAARVLAVRSDVLELHGVVGIPRRMCGKKRTLPSGPPGTDADEQGWGGGVCKSNEVAVSALCVGHAVWRGARSAASRQFVAGAGTGPRFTRGRQRRPRRCLREQLQGARHLHARQRRRRRQGP